MTDRFVSSRAGNENGDLMYKTLRPEKKLQHFRDVTESLMNDALDLWAELWEEFEGRVVSGVAVLPEAERGFKPRSGWPVFLEKMCLLRYYLDSVRKFSEQDQQSGR